MKAKQLAVFTAGLQAMLSGSMLLQSAAYAAGMPVDIPFKLEGHNIVVQVELKPGHRLPFAFDSGLSIGDIITSEAAKALGLKADQKMGVTDAGGDRNAAKLTKIPSIRIGGATLTDQLFAITTVPKKVLERPDGSSLAGYIGAPLMQDAVLCIDYSHRVLHRWAREDFDAAGLVSVPMRLSHGLPTIGVNIDGRLATLIVDSGNDGAVTVYAAFAEKNDFPKRYPNFVPETGNGGGGQDFQVMGGEADSVALTQSDGFQHVPMDVIPQGMDPTWGIDGMVGFKVLEQLNPCIDHEGGRFLFKDQ